MARLTVSLNISTIDHLNYYIKKTYGEHKGLSLTVDQAIKEFLCTHLKCAQCGKDFTPYNSSDSWVLHHKISIAEGGTDEAENRMPLCRTCHQHIHDIGSKAGEAAHRHKLERDKITYRAD